MVELNSITLPSEYDVLAPDASEIRFLCQVKGGSMVHCSLPAGQTTQAVQHKAVEELWYFVEGKGEVWRSHANGDEILPVEAGMSLNIPLGVKFQFRNTGDIPLKFIITTMPPWPGSEEAVMVAGQW